MLPNDSLSFQNFCHVGCIRKFIAACKAQEITIAIPFHISYEGTIHKCLETMSDKTVIRTN